ncbi:SDR family NAD(P)-dependent oxidoreductase [Paraburkholderia bengalensis]|uniref:SDR family NAD(P)-dependent oxidoreductase n=1 Tax=Paraburkholderia bengalensis TaxID=2747562 RepID=UPI003014C53E
MQAWLPGMRTRESGRIVNLSSLVALNVTNRTAYAAARAAIMSFTRTWPLNAMPRLCHRVKHPPIADRTRRAHAHAPVQQQVR